MELPPEIRQLQIPLLYLTNIISLGFKPGFSRILLTLPITLILISQSLFASNEIYYGDKYSFACLALSVSFVSVDWILLANPDKEHWRKRSLRKEVSKEVEGKEQKEDTSIPQSFLKRAWWGIRLAPTTRYVGWSQEVKNVPVESDQGKWRFLVRKILRIAIMLLISDTASSISASSPHGAYRGFENGKVPIDLDSVSFAEAFFWVWIHIFITYSSLELFNTACGVVAVLLNLATPQDCPSAFGDLKEMYTVRKCWSIVWHQNCRRICSAPSIFLVRDVLKLRKGSFASKYIQLFIGFFVSATVHGGAAMLCHKSWTDDDGAFSVFMMQAAIIMVEDHIIELGKTLGFKEGRGWRLLGYVWTVVWFGLSIRPYTSRGIKHGLWIHQKTFDVFGLGPKV